MLRNQDIRFDPLVTENSRKSPARLEQLHRRRVSVVFALQPRKSVTRSPQILSPDMRHAIGSSNDLDLPPKLGRRLLSDAVSREQETHNANGHESQPDRYIFHVTDTLTIASWIIARVDSENLSYIMCVIFAWIT